MTDKQEEDELAALRREVTSLRGRISELERRAARFREEDGPEGSAAVGDSISEREALLVEAERVAHMGSWVWDVEKNTVSWSDELFRILGYDPGEQEASVEAFFARVHPDDLERVQALSAQGASEGVAKPTEHRVLRPDGSVRHVVTDGAMLYDAAGKLRRIVGTLLDRTESLEAELQTRRTVEELDQAQEIAHLASWSVEASTGKVRWSRELYRILGLEPGVEPSSEVFWNCAHPDDRQRLRTLHELSLREKRGAETDARILRPDGELRHVRIKGIPILDADGNLEEMRGTLLDVTEQVELRERLTHAAKMEAVGRLAGGIAHDFNNILTVISGNLGLLATGDEPDREEIRDALKAVGSAQALTGRLLAFGRKANLDRRVVDPNELVRGTLRLLRRVIGDQVELEADLGHDVPEIEVDPVQVEQSLINLVTNARDAMPGGGTVRLSTSLLSDGDGRWVEICVSDDGAGMDEETRRSVFEPFYTTKGVGRGTGLGLAMVLGTIEQHGGRVDVVSAPGQGSTFRVRLPVIEGARSRRVSTIPPLATNDTVSPARILVVEDQPMVAQVIGRTLLKSGHEVLVTGKPSEAMAVFEREPGIELIVCDVVMSEMRGPDLIERLRSRGRPFEVLFVTGYSQELVDRKLGGTVLAKPFTPKELREAVNQLLARRDRTPSRRSVPVV